MLTHLTRALYRMVTQHSQEHLLQPCAHPHFLVASSSSQIRASPLPPTCIQGMYIKGNLIIEGNLLLPHLGAFYPEVDGSIKVIDNPTMKASSKNGLGSCCLQYVSHLILLLTGNLERRGPRWGATSCHFDEREEYSSTSPSPSSRSQ